MSLPLVSIIVPIYNVEKYLIRCLDSIVKQTYSNIEIICIEDCSSDNSRRILEVYSKKDNRIRKIYNEKNLGLSATRNRGISEASGEYICFIDSDDYIEYDMVDVLIKKLVESKYDMLGFGFFSEFESPDTKKKVSEYSCSYEDYLDIEGCGRDVFVQCIRRKCCNVVSWGYIYSRFFLESYNIRFIEKIYHEDVFFYIQCMFSANKVGFLGDRFYHYCRREKSITTDEDKILERLDGICVSIYRIQLLFLESMHKELLFALAEFERIIIKQIRTLYIEIDSIENDYVFKHNETEAILSCAQVGFYNGYFPRKLNKDEMKRIRAASKVVIYGMGAVGLGMKELLDERGINNYEFATTEASLDSGTKSISYYSNNEKVVVIIASVKYEKELTEKAISLGFDDIIIPRFR